MQHLSPTAPVDVSDCAAIRDRIREVVPAGVVVEVIARSAPRELAAIAARDGGTWSTTHVEVAAHVPDGRVVLRRLRVL